MLPEPAGVIDLALEVHDPVSGAARTALEVVAARGSDGIELILVGSLRRHPVVVHRVVVRRQLVPHARVGVVGERRQPRDPQPLGDERKILLHGECRQHVAPEAVAVALVEQRIGVDLGARAVPRGRIAEQHVVVSLAGRIDGREIDRVGRHRVVEQVGRHARGAVFVHELGSHLQRDACRLRDVGRHVALEGVLLHVVAREIVRIGGSAQHAELVVGRGVKEVFDFPAAAAQVDVGVLVGREVLEQQPVPVDVGIDVAVRAKLRIDDLVLGIVVRHAAGPAPPV